MIGYFLVVDVATVAEGVGFGEGAGGEDDVAIGVVVVGRYGCASGIDELHYIALQVSDVVIQHIIDLYRKEPKKMPRQRDLLHLTNQHLHRVQ